LTPNSALISGGDSQMPTPPRGPVTDENQFAGQVRTLDRDLLRPPIRPSSGRPRSTVIRPRASMNVAASTAICSMVSGTSPLVEATPVLLNRNDFAVGREPVADRRVVVVEVADEVLEEHDRAPAQRPGCRSGDRRSGCRRPRRIG